MRTLNGIRLLDKKWSNTKKDNNLTKVLGISTQRYFGFPLDLTELILRKWYDGRSKGFPIEMQKQKDRARNAAPETGDWTNDNDPIFGYDFNNTEALDSSPKGETKETRVLPNSVFSNTFYAEQGGQVGEWLDDIHRNRRKEKRYSILREKTTSLCIWLKNYLPI